MLRLLLLPGCAPSVPAERAWPTPGDHDSGAPPGDSDSDSGDSGSTPEDDAVIVAATFPASMECEAEQTAIVQVRNTGTATWTREGGYKLGANGDQDDFYGPDTRVWLDEGDLVGPGQTWTFTIRLVAPSQAGTYVTDWRMVHEGVAWFGETTAHEVVVACESGSWVCGEGARNGDEICDDAAFTAPGPGVRIALKCESATGGVAYMSTNTGPPCSDGVPRCQGWEEQGLNAWEYLDYIVRLDCEYDGQFEEVDLTAWEGQTLYVGAHTQTDGSGRMTWGCAATWQ